MVLHPQLRVEIYIALILLDSEKAKSNEIYLPFPE
jgi:hypothetical protein